MLFIKVRQWTSIAPSNVTFKNAYKVRAMQDGEDDPRPVPHSFTFVKRSG